MHPPPFAPTKTSRCPPFEPPQRIERSAVGKVGGNWPSATVSSAVIWNGPQNHAKSLIFMLDGGSGSASKTSLLCNSVPSSSENNIGKGYQHCVGEFPCSVTCLGVKELRPHICITKKQQNSILRVMFICVLRENLSCSDASRLTKRKRWQRIWRRRLATRSEFVS